MAPLHAALLMALLALPAIGMALWFSRDPRPTSPPMALHMALIGIVMLLLALATYLFAADARLMRTIALGAVLLVNGLVVSLLIAVRRVHKRLQQQ
ncbi:hypothetical protein [Luteimonas sp. e5]